MLPKSFESLFKFNIQINPYHTRASDKYYVPYMRLSLSKKSICVIGPKIWNEYYDYIALHKSKSIYT